MRDAPGGAPSGSSRTGGTRTLSLSVEPLRRVGALAVDAHLALAHQAVDAAARHRAEEPQQELVEALPGLVLGSISMWLHALCDWRLMVAAAAIADLMP